MLIHQVLLGIQQGLYPGLGKGVDRNRVGLGEPPGQMQLGEVAHVRLGVHPHFIRNPRVSSEVVGRSSTS